LHIPWPSALAFFVIFSFAAAAAAAAKGERRTYIRHL
jgi:hypothetical protein